MKAKIFIKLFPILLITVCFTTELFAQMGANAGDDQEACAGDMVMLGGSPTFPDGSASFTWTASAGPTPSPTANPMVMIPESGAPETITYTVKVKTSNGFECEDEVEVSVVTITEPTFAPPFFLLEDGNMVTASAMITPGSGAPNMIEWSISDDPAGTGCMIDPMTGVVSGCSSAGTIKVKAAHSENTECFKEAELCVNDEACCMAMGTRTWGPVTATIPLTSSMNADSDGYCAFSLDAGEGASLMIGMEDMSYNFMGSLPGIIVSWEEKNPGDYKNISISWDGSENIGSFGPITANLTHVGLSIDASGTLSGNATFMVELTSDINIGGIAKIKQGLGGSITYNYSGSGLGGSFDFSGISGFVAEIQRPSGPVIGRVTAPSGAFESNGKATGLVFEAVPASYTASGFTIAMESLSLMFDLTIGPGMQADFTGGSGQVKLTFLPSTGVTGDVSLMLTHDGSQFSAMADVNSLMAFGTTLSGNVEADFNEMFVLTRVEGQDISINFADFTPSAINNIDFEISNGMLTSFSFSVPTIKYNSIEFNISQVAYANSELSITASLTLPSLMVNVEDFKIDGMGNITIGNAEASISSGPVSANVNISYDGMVFMGGFSGSFAGIGSMSGTANFGASGNFNFGHFTFSIASSGAGIPIGGLRITGVAGEFGYNWEAGGSSDPNNCSGGGSPPMGSASDGAITIGFGITVRDVGNVVEACGYLQTTISAATTISLDLAVKVYANPPHYFNGEASISYVLGSSNVSGSLTSDFKVPPGSGTILNMNSNINFGINGNNWTADGSGSGMLLDIIPYNGSFDVSANLQSGSISGSATGTASYSAGFFFEWPASGFDGCGPFSFWISGIFMVNLSGTITGTISPNNFEASAAINVNGSLNTSVAWPCVFCVSNCISVYSVSFNGDLTLSRSGGQTKLNGEMTFASGGNIDCDPDDPMDCEPPEESETRTIEFIL